MTVLAPSPSQTTSTPIELVEDHDELYPKWKALGLRNEILIHLDDHSDFQWINDKDPSELLKAESIQEVRSQLQSEKGWLADDRVNRKIHLGNYLCAALRDGMFKTWYWAVPDPVWDNPKAKETYWKELEYLFQYRLGTMSKPHRDERRFRTKIYDTDVTVMPLRNFPRFYEPVVLSVDVDYLTSEGTDKLFTPKEYRCRLPWIWPENLAEIFKEKNIVSKHTGISFSVHGGFTPVQYKFLGYVIQEILQGASPSQEYRNLKRSFELRNQGKPQEAIDLLRLFQAVGSLEAARCYQKAQLFYESGDMAKARSSFQKCLELEISFKRPYNSYGLLYENMDRYDYALEEHEMTQALAPELMDPVIGEARCLQKLKRWDEAIQRYRHVLVKQPNHATALLNLGMICFKKKQKKESMDYLKKALKQDESLWEAHYLMGHCYLSLNQYDEAKVSFRETLKLGIHEPGPYAGLGSAYWHLGLRYKAFENFWESLRLRGVLIKKRIKEWKES